MEIIYTHSPFVAERATLLVLKVPEEIFHVQSKITASSNTKYVAVSFSVDFTIKKF